MLFLLLTSSLLLQKQLWLGQPLALMLPIPLDRDLWKIHSKIDSGQVEPLARLVMLLGYFQVLRLVVLTWRLFSSTTSSMMEGAIADEDGDSLLLFLVLTLLVKPRLKTQDSSDSGVTQLTKVFSTMIITNHSFSRDGHHRLSTQLIINSIVSTLVLIQPTLYRWCLVVICVLHTNIILLMIHASMNKLLLAWPLAELIMLAEISKDRVNSSTPQMFIAVLGLIPVLSITLVFLEEMNPQITVVFKLQSQDHLRLLDPSAALMKTLPLFQLVTVIAQNGQRVQPSILF